MRKGFTLVELMVVVAIMGVMISVSSDVGDFFKTSGRSKLEANNFFNMISLARTLAITGKRDICVEITAAKTLLSSCAGTTQDAVITNLSPTGDARTDANIARVQRIFNRMKNTYNNLQIKSATNIYVNATLQSTRIQIAFNSRGMLISPTNAQRIGFKEGDQNSYNLVQLSITGSIRTCKATSLNANCDWGIKWRDFQL